MALRAIPYGRKQTTDLIVNCAGVAHQSSNLFAQNFPISPAQSMNRNLHGGQTHPQLASYLIVASGAFFAGQKHLQLLEVTGPSSLRPFRLQAIKNLFAAR